ncbi:MAG: hypothetical protein M3Q81_05215 [bacterium]|nr:hypothetical protein [bacterium]
MAKSEYHKPTTVAEAWSNPRYQGKIVVAAGGEVHGTYDDEKALQLLKKLERKYPDQTPETTIIPQRRVVLITRE